MIHDKNKDQTNKTKNKNQMKKISENQNRDTTLKYMNH